MGIVMPKAPLLTVTGAQQEKGVVNMDRASIDCHVGR